MRQVCLKDYGEFLRGWNGVPYRDSGCSKQGVDCFRFVILALDWLHGWEDGPSLSPKLPRDIAQHDAYRAGLAVRWMLDRYPHREKWRRSDGGEPKTSPGDVVLVYNGSMPGHIMICGDRPCELWHSLNGWHTGQRGRVERSSLGWALSQGISKIWTCSDICIK
jgi:hypothetical protein